MPYPDERTCKPTVPGAETPLATPAVPNSTVPTPCTVLCHSNINPDVEARGLLSVKVDSIYLYVDDTGDNYVDHTGDFYEDK